MVDSALLAYEWNLESVANAWLACGASMVRLLYHDQEVFCYPNAEPPPGPCLVSRDQGVDLVLQLYGLSGGPWGVMAQAQLEWIARTIGAEGEMENLTTALVETQDRLVALYELTQVARRQVGIGDVLDLLVSESHRMLDCEKTFAVLMQPGHEEIIRQSGDIPLPVAELVQVAEWLRAQDVKRLFKTDWLSEASCLLLITLPVRESVFAVLGLSRPSCADFNSPDIKLMQSVADQIGARLENALLTQEALSRARIETEMVVARQVQMSLLPQVIPTVVGLDVFGVSAPASHVGGDFFNVECAADQSFSFYIGDITGKGIPAALMMTMTRTVANLLVRAVPPVPPAELVGRINSELATDFSNARMFTTLFAGQHDPVTRKLCYINAGQSPILFAPRNGKAHLLMADDIPVGILPDVVYTPVELDLQVGDVLVAATDGFSETWNQSGEMFGYTRLETFLDEIKHLSARGIADALFQAVEGYGDGRAQDDDRTLVVLKAVPVAGTVSFEFPAVLTELQAASEALGKILAHTVGQQISAQDAYACELALQELLSNLVRHACRGDARKRIRVCLSVDPAAQRVTMETEEDGQENHLDLTKVEMPDPSTMSEGGYGLPLIRALVDQLSYRRENGYNRWKLLKYF